MRPSEEKILTAVEDLEDLLYPVSGRPSLVQGLELCQRLIRRRIGGLYIREWEAQGENPWLRAGGLTARGFRTGSEDPELLDLALQAVMEGNEVEGPAGKNTALVIPLQHEGNMVGAWLIQGRRLPEKSLQLARHLARSLGRAIAELRIANVENMPGRDAAALRIVSTALNPDASVNDIQLWIVRGIRELLDCEAVTLTLLDDQMEDAAVQKTFIGGDAWQARKTIHLDPSFLEDTLRSEVVRSFDSFNPHSGYNAELDGVVGIGMRSLLCSPLISNRQTLGVVSAVNLPPGQIPGAIMDLLNTMVRYLGNSIFNLKLIQQLKTTNADLESSRWELLHSRNTLRALFDSIPSSIYIIDRRYSLVAINMSRADRAGQHPTQLVGRKCFNALFQRNDPCPGCRVSETLLQGQMTNRVGRVWVTPDQAVDWDISSFPIYETGKLPAQAIMLEQDITEKRRLEENLIQNEKLAAVGQLAAGVAHEINNPLSAIIANAQILRSELDPANTDAIESVDLIEVAGLRASQVVRNLLGIARKEQFDLALIDLNDTVNASLSLIQHELVTRPIQLTCDLAEDLPRIKASRDHLQGVWINLILNAIDALEDQPGEIRISTHYQNNEFRVVVQDSGKGIAPEGISRIFEPFYTTKATGRGTGLGLSLCHQVVKQHGGYIQVESSLGAGTKFVIVLPEGGAP